MQFHNPIHLLEGIKKGEESIFDAKILQRVLETSN